MCESFTDANKHNADADFLLRAPIQQSEKRVLVKHVATIESASELSALPREDKELKGIWHVK